MVVGTDTRPKIMVRFCTRCDVLLGREFSHFRGEGPLCEVCADHVRQEYHRREQRERRIWDDWIGVLLGRHL